MNIMRRIYRFVRIYLNDNHGASTVEVAIIVPMIWMIIMIITFLLFFFFDMGVLRSEIVRTANDTAREWREDGGHKSQIFKEELHSNLQKKLILADVDSESIAVSFGTVTVKAKMNFILDGKGITFSDTAKAAIDNREEWMRIWKS